MTPPKDASDKTVTPMEEQTNPSAPRNTEQMTGLQRLLVIAATAPWQGCLIGLMKGDPVLVETTSPAPTDRIEDAQPDGQELVRRAEAQRVEDELTAELEKEVADHIERMLALHVAEEFPPATPKMMAEHYAGMLAKRW